MGKKKMHRKKQKQKQVQTQDRSTPLRSKDMIALIISFLVVFVLYKTVGGYKWLWDTLVIGNIKMIRKYPDLTIEKKWEVKCGFDYTYLNFIKKNTPEDAIILMPSDSALYPEGQKSDFNTRNSAGVKNKAWSTYFLYPRKVVYEREKESNPLYTKVNYVAIANYKGYEKLSYKIDKKQKYYVLPISLEEESKK